MPSTLVIVVHWFSHLDYPGYFSWFQGTLLQLSFFFLDQEFLKITSFSFTNIILRAVFKAVLITVIANITGKATSKLWATNVFHCSFPPTSERTRTLLAVLSQLMTLPYQLISLSLHTLALGHYKIRVKLKKSFQLKHG